MTMSEGRWKALELASNFIGRGIGPALIAGAVAWVGIQANARLNDTNTRIQQQAEVSKRINLNLDVIRRQKELDTDVEMRLLENLLQGVFQPNGRGMDSELAETWMLLAELVALNLWDVPVNLKPLFQFLDDQFGSEPGRKDQIRDIAKAVARKQAFRLASGGNGWDSGELEVEGGTSKPFPNVAFAESTLEIEFGAISDDEIEAKLVYGTGIGDIFGPFGVSYFDMPFIDNSKRELFRVSLLLLDTDPDRNKAKVRLIAFDSHLATDRIDITEVSKMLSIIPVVSSDEQLQ